MNNLDRRIFHRLSMHIKARVTAGDLLITDAICTNLSLGGALIEISEVQRLIDPQLESQCIVELTDECIPDNNVV